MLKFKKSLDPYRKLKSLLAPVLHEAGMEKVFEKGPEAFGCMHSIFSDGRSNIMLVWDGKDGWGFASHSQSATKEKWKDVPIYFTKAELENDEANREKIKQFLATVRDIVTDDKTA